MFGIRGREAQGVEAYLTNSGYLVQLHEKLAFATRRTTMRRILVRIIGISLIVAGILGLVFSAVALVALIRVQKNVEAAAAQQLDLMQRALVATHDGLQVADTSLGQASDTVRSLEATIGGMASTVEGALPAFDAVSGLLGESLPSTVETAQQTLRSAATGAGFIDDFLKAVSAIPFIGTMAYTPEESLSQGLGTTADSLDGIPAALRSAQSGLTATSTNLPALGGLFGEIANNVGQIAASLDTGLSVLTQYQGVIADLQKSVAWVQQALPDWLRWLRWGVSLLLIWLGVAQFALITQGWELVGRSRRPEQV
jgi:methyl-accepting chemotaxis protein